jgi:hypothetical protein
MALPVKPSPEKRNIKKKKTRKKDRNDARERTVVAKDRAAESLDRDFPAAGRFGAPCELARR